MKYEKEEYPCAITSNIGISSDMEENKELVLPRGYLLAYVKATEDTLNTKEGQRFLIDNNAYEVQTIDIVSNTENRIGIVQMNLKQVPKNNDESIENDVEKNIDNRNKDWKW